MPHVIVKLHAGRSGQQKAAIAELVTQAIIAGTGNGEGSVSVAIEDVEPAEWTRKVYEPDIEGRRNQLYKMPGYGPLAGTRPASR